MKYKIIAVNNDTTIKTIVAEISEEEYETIMSNIKQLQISMLSIDYYVVVRDNIKELLAFLPTIKMQDKYSIDTINRYTYNVLGTFYAWIEYYESHYKKIFEPIKKKYYDKVLLRYDYSNEGEGKIDYVYPLKPNENGMLFVVYADSDTDYITFVANDFSSEYFKCNTGISEIGYIDSEYESNKITDATTIENNLSCKVVTDDSPFYDVELDHSKEEYNQEKAKYSNRV